MLDVLVTIISSSFFWFFEFVQMNQCTSCYAVNVGCVKLYEQVLVPSLKLGEQGYDLEISRYQEEDGDPWSAPALSCCYEQVV